MAVMPGLRLNDLLRFAVSDTKSRPVPATLGVAAVDESMFALRARNETEREASTNPELSWLLTHHGVR